LTGQEAVHRTDEDESDYMPGFHAMQVWRATKELELERQRLVLLERKTKLIMRVVTTLFAMAYLVCVLLLVPWVLLPTGAAAALAYRWR